MGAWQRFQAFPKAARAWCWALAAASACLLVNIIYVNTESPYWYTGADGTTVSGLTASQMNGICVTPAGQAMQLVNSSSAVTCSNAQSVEQGKAVSAWLLVFALAALITLVGVFWNKTLRAGQRAAAAPGGTPPPPGWTAPQGGTPQPGHASPQAGPQQAPAQDPDPPRQPASLRSGGGNETRA